MKIYQNWEYHRFNAAMIYNTNIAKSIDGKEPHQLLPLPTDYKKIIKDKENLRDNFIEGFNNAVKAGFLKTELTGAQAWEQKLIKAKANGN